MFRELKESDSLKDLKTPENFKQYPGYPGFLTNIIGSGTRHFKPKT
jgi:hypothetical protein